ncbi:zinc finger MIZ domain-containing protein 2-like isoform X2 [Oncorhynchus mykiss]|uniref:zinc finger MIZ domain-containing protein 2-like isoform X2 n=1 Tax=Oncorhynchus mykiss TaxID=8022 RepID=UPI0018783540|nr:zinc finger MIZ domain-containing protein 2-like isoform X2 [Oncorhynchus mykiss]
MDNELAAGGVSGVYNIFNQAAVNGRQTGQGDAWLSKLSPSWKPHPSHNPRQCDAPYMSPGHDVKPTYLPDIKPNTNSLPPPLPTALTADRLRS